MAQSPPLYKKLLTLADQLLQGRAPAWGDGTVSATFARGLIDLDNNLVISPTQALALYTLIQNVNQANGVVQLDGAGKLPAVDGSALLNLAWAALNGKPTTLSGYGITDPVVLTSGAYTNPAWISALAWAKITGTPATLAGYGVTDVPASLLSGTIDIARIPQGALERLSVVADAAARLALTSATVHNGDTVKQNDTGQLYFVSDDTKLGSEDAFQTYATGTAAAVEWTNILSKPTAFPASVVASGVTVGGTATQKGAQNEVYISLRTDGLAGLGTKEDPFDGSTTAKLKALLTAIPANSSIYFGPGTFTIQPLSHYNTGGAVECGVELKTGWKIYGQGRRNTILRADYSGLTGLSDYPNSGFVVLGGPTPSTTTLQSVEIHDLSLDCNAGAAGVNLPSTTSTASIFSICGSNILVENVEAYGMWAPTSTDETFFAGLTASDNPPGTESVNLIIRDCFFHSPVQGARGDMVGFFTGWSTDTMTSRYCLIEGCVIDGKDASGSVGSQGINTFSGSGSSGISCLVARKNYVTNVGTSFFSDTQTIAGKGWVIADNILVPGAGAWAIFIASALTDSLITNNYIDTSGDGTAATGGIALTNASNARIAVTGNTITNTSGGQNIWFDGLNFGTNVRVSGNTVFGSNITTFNSGSPGTANVMDANYVGTQVTGFPILDLNNTWTGKNIFTSTADGTLVVGASFTLSGHLASFFGKTSFGSGNGGVSIGRDDGTDIYIESGIYNDPRGIRISAPTRIVIASGGSNPGSTFDATTGDVTNSGNLGCKGTISTANNLANEYYGLTLGEDDGSETFVKAGTERNLALLAGSVNGNKVILGSRTSFSFSHDPTSHVTWMQGRALVNNATDDGSTALQVNGSAAFAGLISPQQASSAPTYQKGAIYFDTSLNKLRIGGASAWETVTST